MAQAGPTRFSWQPTLFSAAVANRLPLWLRATGFRRHMRMVGASKLGGLMTYNIKVASAFRQVGIYAGKILMDVKPADRPVLQPINFALVVSLRTAKTLGITVPNTLVALADELIE
jgi:hypothetical protein